jgi:hypothetical protein
MSRDTNPFASGSRPAELWLLTVTTGFATETRTYRSEAEMRRWAIKYAEHGRTVVAAERVTVTYAATDHR